MRSFSPKTLLIASLLSALPLAGAYAKSGALDETPPTAVNGPRLTALFDQAQGVRQGISDARQNHEIGAAEAHRLDMRLNAVAGTARRVAAADHGNLPAGRYHQMLRRLDRVDQRLLGDTGSGFAIGDGSDGGNYPNG